MSYKVFEPKTEDACQPSGRCAMLCGPLMLWPVRTRGLNKRNLSVIRQDLIIELTVQYICLTLNSC